MNRTSPLHLAEEILSASQRVGTDRSAVWMTEN